MRSAGDRLKLEQTQDSIGRLGRSELSPPRCGATPEDRIDALSGWPPRIIGQWQVHNSLWTHQRAVHHSEIPLLHMPQFHCATQKYPCMQCPGKHQQSRCVSVESMHCFEQPVRLREGLDDAGWIQRGTGRNAGHSRRFVDYHQMLIGKHNTGRECLGGVHRIASPFERPLEYAQRLHPAAENLCWDGVSNQIG